jgi:uncharacterized membrane protein
MSRVKIALFVSMALNLLVIGAVAGTMYGVRYNMPVRHYSSGKSEDFGLMGITRSMPEARRKEIRKGLGADRARLRPMIEEIRALRRAAADQLAAEPYDRAALEAAIAKVADKEREFRKTAVDMFLSRAETLTPDERRLLADAWRRRSESYHRHPSRRGDHRGKDEESNPGETDQKSGQQPQTPAPSSQP